MTAAVHPGWCAIEHDPASAHSSDIGEDVELAGGASMFVELLQAAGAPAQVLLYHHTAEETVSTSLSLDETLQIRDRLSTAIALVLREGVLGG